MPSELMTLTPLRAGIWVIETNNDLQMFSSAVAQISGISDTEDAGTTRWIRSYDLCVLYSQIALDISYRSPWLLIIRSIYLRGRTLRNFYNCFNQSSS